MDRIVDAWVQEVLRYNRRLHLVSRSMERSLADQVRDAMALMEHIEEPVIGDLGSGSGFLGIPYKAVCPSSRISLIERSEKKCIFLRHVIDLLTLDGMEVIEADPLKDAVGPLPALMTRSFSPKESLIQAVLSTLEPGGRFYYFQTGEREPVSHPQLTLKESWSKDFGTYRLNLDRYLVTSR